MMKVLLAIVGFLAFVVGLVLLARTLEPAVVAPPPRVPRVVEKEEPPLPALFVVRNDVDQTPIALAGPRSKPMLLHLWASWCGPCIAELPSVLALGRKGAFDVVAVSVDDRWPDVVRYFAGKIPPEVAWDPKVTLEPALGVRSLPTTFLVDTQGRVRARHTGAQNWLDPEMIVTLYRTLGDSP